MWDLLEDIAYVWNLLEDIAYVWDMLEDIASVWGSVQYSICGGIIAYVWGYVGGYRISVGICLI